jgi:hypothetical protein
MENKDFNIAKFLKENRLGSYGVLNHYVDIKPLKEEEDGAYEEQDEVPYEGPDDKLTGQGDEDSFEQDEIISEAPARIEWEDLDDTDLEGPGMEIEIDDIIFDTQKRIDKYVAAIGSENPLQTAAQIRLLIKKLWMSKIQLWGKRSGMYERFGDEWHPETMADAPQAPQAGTEEDVLAAMITALQDAGFSKQEIEQLSHTISNDPSVLDFGDF